jgi:hypothetical protein
MRRGGIRAKKENGSDGELIVSVKVQNFLFDRITPRYQINGERALVIVQTFQKSK